MSAVRVRTLIKSYGSPLTPGELRKRNEILPLLNATERERYRKARRVWWDPRTAEITTSTVDDHA